MKAPHSPLPSGPDGALSWCESCSMYCGGTNSDGQPIRCNCCPAPAARPAPRPAPRPARQEPGTPDS